MKAIKRLILFVIGLASLLIIGAVALVVLVDPNDYKGFAQDAVKKRLDLDLSITEVSWQFFPNIGLRLNGVSLTDPQQSQEDSVLIKADSATVAVALLPLLKQAIDVKNVQLNSPQIRFAQYADGRSNWDPLLKNPNVKNSSAAEAASQQIPSQQAPSQPDDTPSNGAPSAPEQTADDANPLSALAINVNIIRIVDGTVYLVDHTTQTTTSIDRLSAEISDVALDKAIPVQFFVALKQDETLDTTLAGSGHLKAHPDFQRFDIIDLALTANIMRAPGFTRSQQLSAQLSAAVDLSADTATVSNMTLKWDELQASAQATITQLSQDLVLAGSLHVSDFNPQRWLDKALSVELPPTSDASALQHARLEATIHGALGGAQPTIKLQPITLVLDQSTLTGEASVDLSTQQLIGSFQLDNLNLDRYLPPTSEAATQDTPAIAETEPTSATASNQSDASAASSDDSPLIPVETLRPLWADVRLSAKQLTAKKIAITDLNLHATAQHGLLTLDQFEALTLNGQVKTSGTLDVRGPTPTITVQHSTQGLQLNPLLVGILNKDVIAGLANITVQMSSQGNTLDTLIQGLSGNGQFSLENGALKGMNLTELAHSALKDWNTLLASFLPQDYQKRVPPAFQRDTEIQKLLTTLTIREGKLQANRIDAKLKGSALSGGGEINLSTFGYDSQLKLKLSESLTNPYIAQLEWPLQCSSNTKRLIPCKIDKHAVGRQIEKMAAKEAKRKAKATITKKVADKLGITESVNSPEDAAKAKLREEEKRAKQRLKEQLQEKFGGFH